ncbi:MAG: protein-disulfide reductase DsbD domain-containing protein, partial [Flavobacteriales bacterium]
MHWQFKSKALGNNRFQLQLIAGIDAGWHIYAQHLEGTGPIPTSFKFEPGSGYQLIGAVAEPKAESEYDPNFDMELKYFEDEAVFRQEVQLIKAGDITIQGELEFMVCDNKQCLPPETVDFSFKLSGKEETAKISDEEPSSAVAPVSEPKTGKTPDLATDSIKNPVNWTFRTTEEAGGEWRVILSASIEPGWHIYSKDIPDGEGPVPTSFRFNKQDAYALKGDIDERGDLINEYDSAFGMQLKYFEDSVVYSQSIRLLKPGAVVNGTLEYMVCNDRECLPPEEVEFEVQVGGPISVQTGDSGDDAASKSLWAIFIAGFLGGLLALLTPCVFPMIPLTVSFFTKQSKNKVTGIRNAVIYGLSIIFIYVLLAFGITKIFGPSAMNALSTNVWFNVAFFILFVVFAVSFFGAFEIRLPSSWINRADRASDKGGVIGIFFMAFTLSLVSFSCTGPIIGTLLVEAAVHGGVIGPVTGMVGFSLALALPFALFAAFPGWLQSLPQSGGWLNAVKVSLGFMELAFALKFLSNADLV